MSSPDVVLSIKDLVIEFAGKDGPVRVVDEVSLEVRRDEVLGIVGESGSGKSLTMLAVMGLLPAGARITRGEIRVLGRQTSQMSASERRAMRGKDLAIVFQDPLTSLNPVHKIGTQIAEMVRLHQPQLKRREVKARAVELLKMVRIPNAEACYGSYPHEFSGGMRQRAMIAMAMAHSPALLIADEPTTALDVTVQAQVLRVLREMRSRAHSSLALITHDLGLVAQTADRVVVMYAGRVMETGTVTEVFDDPSHPYTAGLIASSLSTASPAQTAFAIPGRRPAAGQFGAGCVFQSRCFISNGREACSTQLPVLKPLAAPEHAAACHFTTETAAWLATTRNISQPTES